MILVRYSGPDPVGQAKTMIAIISPVLSNAELYELVLPKVVRWHGWTGGPNRAAFTTQDGRQGERTIIDLRGPLPQEVKGPFAFHPVWDFFIRGDEPFVIEHINSPENLDFAEAWIPLSLQRSVPDWLRTLLALAFEETQTALIEGWHDRQSFVCVEELLHVCLEWGVQATLEVLWLFDRKSLWESAKFGVAEDNWRTLHEVLHSGYETARLSPSYFPPKEHYEDILFLLTLARALLKKHWQVEFLSFHDVGRRCRLDRVDPHGRPWFFNRALRQRVMSTLENPEISSDEFVDLLSVDPPEGYVALRRLSNTSAFKVVYMAQNSEGRYVALKRYKAWDSDDISRLLQRLGITREDILRKDTLTDWMGRIRHTHILPCLVMRAEDEFFIVEPLLDLTLDRMTFHDLKGLVRIVLEACEGLAFFHKEGGVHGDIKPDNIGIHSGKTVLFDFGIASFEAGDRRPRSNPGSIKTRAPELFSETAIPTSASDVWAMGATIMALASGGVYPFLEREEVKRMPPAGDPGRAALEEIIAERIQQYRSNRDQFKEHIRKAIPNDLAGLSHVVVACCRVNPEDRPSADGLIAMLRKVQDACEIPSG